MELILTLWILYVLQCTTWLPGDACSFIRPFRSWRVVRGPGWQFLHPLPSAASVRAVRFPLVESRGSLRARGGATWKSPPVAGNRAAAIDLEALSTAEARGTSVVLAGRVIQQSGSRSESERMADLLRRLGSSGFDAVEELLEREFSERLSIDSFRERRASVRRAVRPLGWASNLYAIALLGVLPVAILVRGDENGLLMTLPLVAFLHVVTLLALVVAVHRLFPARRLSRAGEIVSAALYPPQLLRTYQSLMTEMLGGFDPAVVGAAVLDDGRERDLLRTEVLRRRCDDESGPLHLVRFERRALSQLLESLGIGHAELVAAPGRRDALAMTYCPICRTEYRLPVGACADCGLELVRFDPGTTAERPTR